MAETIEKDIRSGRDPRHGLFIVGTGHVYKTTPPGFASCPPDPLGGLPALRRASPAAKSSRSSADQAILGDNGTIQGRLRGGAFDERSLNGDQPTAFAVTGRPLRAREPFDALRRSAIRPPQGRMPAVSTAISSRPPGRRARGHAHRALFRRLWLKYTRGPPWTARPVQEVGSTSRGHLRRRSVPRSRKDSEGRKRWRGLRPWKTAKPRH